MMIPPLLIVYHTQLLSPVFTTIQILPRANGSILEAFPRAGIGSFPTPIEPFPELGTALNVGEFYVKKDSETGGPYGGNKVRKLDYLLGDALNKECRQVHTSGGIGSHHVLATCIYAREVGLEPQAVQLHQPVTDHVCKVIQSIAIIDPEITLVESKLEFLYRLLVAQLRAQVGDELYFIALGGSSPIGTLGYVETIGELQQQMNTDGVP